MASDESMTVRSCISSVQEEEFDHEDDLEGGDFYQPHQHQRQHQYQHQYQYQYHPHNKYFSRLSVCTTTSTDDPEEQVAGTYSNYEDDPEEHNVMGMYHMMSGLSIESFDGDDGDVEDELSDSGFKPTNKVGLDHYHHHHMGLLTTSDSDEESGGGCYSLPATPPRRMRPSGSAGRNHRRRSGDAGKECVSENEAAADRSRRRRWRRKRTIMRETLLRDTNNKFREEETILMMDNQPHERSQRVSAVVVGDEDDDDDEHNSKSSSIGGESQSESSSVLPMVVITRPTGGKRSLRMDLEEVKACRELGFDLETPLPLPLPLHATAVTNNLSADTASTATTSGGNSPVHWRISSPGDDPRDVKARLRVWAQAVALASASRQAS